MTYSNAKCHTCEHWGTFDCPRSDKCYALEHKPYYREYMPPKYGIIKWVQKFFNQFKK